MDLKKLNIYIQSGFYIIAGLNHFVNPDFYYPLIPEYFIFPERINLIAGIFEIILGIGLLLPLLRKASSFAIILMLIAFIPSHIYFIQQGSCIDGGLCVPQWVGWVRLMVIHPLLMYWAYSAGKTRRLTVFEKEFEDIGEAILNNEKLNPDIYKKD